ncbi:uncharacterized protein LOC118458732 [Anopheles albimanus]|uniref:uncharacterized protein LOC118458732 n=1 Tax=Anopheles albimanus TaxID=7167 RepID=UPI00164113BB|nr:uncharacterized protein LOC118458732 [Anopheles albimanus]
MASQKRLALLLVVTTILPNGTSGLCTATIDRAASSCAFNPLLLLVPHSGWVLSKQNCGEVIDLEAFAVPPVLFFDLADPDRLYTVVFLEFGRHGHRGPLRWLIANVPGPLLLQDMTYIDGDTAMDYLPPADDDADDDADGQPARYGFYLYEQVYGSIYPPAAASSYEDRFDLDAWIDTISPEGALCGPVASIGFGARTSAHPAAS